MVVINGVKYACERCIRGHRVSTCIHTDQPLTMIKPKGRPSTQCQHCRDQRKLKNLHINCACQKKGKSPGQHLASCYKNPNGCTCYQNHKLKALDKSKKPKDKPLGEGETSDWDLDFKNMLATNLSDSSQSNNNSNANSNSNSHVNLINNPGNNSGINPDTTNPSESITGVPNSKGPDVSNDPNDLRLDIDDYLIDNSMKNINSENTGMFDLFHADTANGNGENPFDANSYSDSNVNDPQRFKDISNPHPSVPFHHDSTDSLVREPLKPTSEDFKQFINDPRVEVNSNGGFTSPNGKMMNGDKDTLEKRLKARSSMSVLNNREPKSESDEIEINENYFPLFPLVGTQSFETNESMPLTSIPSNFQSSISRSHSNSFQRNNNRPESVLSINSNSSISTDISKVDHSAYPPSSMTQNPHLNHSQSNLHSSNLAQPQLLNHTNTITENSKNSFGNILESNELYVSDEELEHFLNDFNDNNNNNNNNNNPAIVNLNNAMNNPPTNGTT